VVKLTDRSLADLVRSYSDQMLAAYRAQPRLVDEHAGLEENISQGGYGRRQIHELIQNGADELIDHQGGRIHVVLTESHLYCANEGSAISEEGVAALLLAHISPKRGDEIGRFGLGFKSVLGVTARPQFLSRAVSFGFDQEWAATQIAAAAGPHEAYPTLRLARVLDLDEECQADEVLADLMSWATTVVRVPLDHPCDWLAEDLENFDPAFLLFSPHVGSLTLEHVTGGLAREIGMTRQEGGDLVLAEDGVEQRWRVFSTEHRPSAKARESAGKLQHRESLPVVWAVPVDGRLEIGQFWAFFPLRDQTTLSGIANAPWQINDDRTGLLEGSPLNEEILVTLVTLVLESLASLAPSSDPGRILDLMPARGREARCWGDGVLTNRFNVDRQHHALVPDQTGELRRIDEVSVPPPSIPAAAQLAWSKHPARPDDWAHPSTATTPTRRNRIAQMLEGADQEPATAAEWLDCLVEAEDAGPLESAEAIKVASVASATDTFDLAESGLNEATVVFNSERKWSRLDPAWIWIEPADKHREPEVVVVHPEVIEHEGVRHALEELGIREVSPILELEALLPEVTDDGDWDKIWQIIREIDDPEEAAAKLRTHARDHGPYRVMAADGSWQPFTQVLLPGRVVALESETDRGVIVDTDHHAPDLDVLTRAGVHPSPIPGGDVRDDPLGRLWKKRVIDQYLHDLQRGGARPDRRLLSVEPSNVPVPFSVMQLLHGVHGARFAAELLEVPGALEPRRVRHRTQDRYPEAACESPTVWALKQWGVLWTSLPDRASGAAQSARPVTSCVGPALAAYRDALPVADVDAVAAERLGLPSTLAAIPSSLWRGLLSEAVAGTPGELGSLLQCALKARIDPIPAIAANDGGRISMSSIVVATPRDDVDAITALHLLVAMVDVAKDAERLCKDWGMRSASEFFTTEVLPVGPGEPARALDLFPDLAVFDQELEALEIILCDQIVIERSSDEGTTTQSVDQQLDHNTLYLVGAAEDYERILDVLVAIKDFDLDAEERQAMLRSRRSGEGRKLQKRIAAKKTLTSKLVAAVGADALIRRLPKSLVQEMGERRGGDLTDEEVAELALAVHGVEVLRIHRDDLTAKGLEVPPRWGGGPAARRFVLDLGFPEEYGGFPSEARDALVQIPGPPALHDLHQFQRDSADRIRKLVAAGRGRGLLSLPTGAGKTRTAVQALVESMRDKELTGPILWVAQTDELCEQAVSAWSDNWRAMGPRQTLKIGRLWSTNHVQDLVDSNQVVIATMAKLETIIDDHAYEWLSRANAIVVDEAHRAIAASYTKLLNWLGMGRGAERAPLIGLSATPFRGTSETQTKALVNRFNGNRLDHIGDDPYTKLQEMGVLAGVEHALLGGADVELSPEELKALETTRRLPSSVLDRVGEDKGRNQEILESVLSLDEDHTVLLFASSVDHAELMAGLLSVEGVPSKAISARTDRGARQHYIEQFRTGEVRVLTNFGVLTEGFDAPAVRAVYVARPTYSPNLYQQMIGRGLRGPKNGGKETCLIVNVADNLDAYGEDLAFREFEYLWDRR
jgi:superfamily II DNA or RNA helicase